MKPMTIKEARKLLRQNCVCKTPGEDDGETTCFPHHDCSKETCTHWDVDDESN